MMAIEIKEYVGKGNIKHVVDTKNVGKKTTKKKTSTTKTSKKESK